MVEATDKVFQGPLETLEALVLVRVPSSTKIDEDIGETNSLAATMPEKVKELKDQLNHWLDEMNAPRPQAKTTN